MWGKGHGVNGECGGEEGERRDGGDDDDDGGGSARAGVKTKTRRSQARRRTCLSTPVIPPIWIIKSKSVFRIHQSPHCSQITPRCVEDENTQQRHGCLWMQSHSVVPPEKSEVVSDE